MLCALLLTAFLAIFFLAPTVTFEFAGMLPRTLAPVLFRLLRRGFGGSVLY